MHLQKPTNMRFVKSIQPVSPNQKNGSPDSVARNLLFSEIISFGVNSVLIPVWQDKKVNKKVMGTNSIIFYAIRNSRITAFGIKH